MASRVRARSGLAERVAVLEEDRGGFGALRQLRAHDVAPMSEPRRHRKAIARIADRAFQAALQRQPSIGRMRHGPARDGAGHRERAGQHAAIGHLVEAALGEGVDGAARCRAAAAVDVAHGLRAGIVDQPEGIAADPGHVRIEDREGGAGGDRGIDRRAARAQHFRTGLRGQRMRARHHAVRRESSRTAGADIHHDAFVTSTDRTTGERCHSSGASSRADFGIASVMAAPMTPKSEPRLRGFRKTRSAPLEWRAPSRRHSSSCRPSSICDWAEFVSGKCARRNG